MSLYFFLVIRYVVRVGMEGITGCVHHISSHSRACAPVALCSTRQPWSPLNMACFRLHFAVQRHEQRASGDE